MENQKKLITKYIDNKFKGECKEIVYQTFHCIELGSGNSINCLDLLNKMKKCKKENNKCTKENKHERKCK